MREEKFDFDDIVIKPSSVSEIESRSEITIRDKYGFLPLFAAPMDTVVDLTNYKLFLENGIRVVLPRTINEYDYPYNENSEYLWFSYSLQDIEKLFLSKPSTVVDDSFLNFDKKQENLRALFIQDYLKDNRLHILIDR